MNTPRIMFSKIDSFQYLRDKRLKHRMPLQLPLPELVWLARDKYTLINKHEVTYRVCRTRCVPCSLQCLALISDGLRYPTEGKQSRSLMV